MQHKYLLIVTAIGEVGIGVPLLLAPAVPLLLLLNISSASQETTFVARVAGAALVGIGVASWLARNDRNTAAQRGLLIGLVIYDFVVAGLLVYAALALNMTGVALWPGVLVHLVLGAWGVACLCTTWSE